MAAPEGNQFWKQRSRHGLETIFESPEVMEEAAQEYFQWCDQHPLIEKGFSADGNEPAKKEHPRPYTIQGLTRHLHVNTLYFSQFKRRILEKNDEKSKGFALVINKIEEAIYENKFTGAATGFFNANIISRDLGLKDQVEATGAGGAPLLSAAITLNMPAGLQINLPDNTEGAAERTLP